MAKEPVYKRRRASRACESCRNLKAKCDGARPICARCLGYGRNCEWKERARRTSIADRGKRLTSSSISDKFREAIRTYEHLVRDLRPRLSNEDRKIVDLGLSTIRRRFPEETSLSDQQVLSPQESTNSLISPVSQRYFGEASDIRFFNAIKQAIYRSSNVENVLNPDLSHGVDDYEQEGQLESPKSDEEQVCLPTKDNATKYLEIYLTTIHIAYPFIEETILSEKHKEFWQRDSLENLQGPWVSLLLTLFAIGACYESFSDAESKHQSMGVPLHQRYFDEAFHVYERNEGCRSIDHIRVLLAQCFYLLAISQINRCWINLGIVVRTAQSIGLHVEDRFKSSDVDRDPRRRVWYSIYVLDRLLALQLGRPPAIHEGDFSVCIPSPLYEEGLHLSMNSLNESKAEGSSAEDYFTSMIAFSRIIGEVLSSLYSPTRVDSIEYTLATTEALDQDLLQWKARLPRPLRFDFGHTFEKSITFKRQRNMLAVKFYHLRALIHRPHLSSATFRSPSLNSSTISDSDGRSIRLSKKLCISSAQSTAKLLHNIDDKKSLVYGFPWWQMISCLICASSILLVASICVDRDHDPDDFDWSAIEEDAEVCLTVFQVLSTNSNAARIARDMMQGLKETRLHIQNALNPAPQDTGMQNLQRSQIGDVSSLQLSDDPMLTQASLNSNMYDFDLHQMAHQVSEPIMWSAQFVNDAYNPFLSQPYPGFEA